MSCDKIFYCLRVEENYYEVSMHACCIAIGELVLNPEYMHVCIATYTYKLCELVILIQGPYWNYKTTRRAQCTYER